MITSLKTVIDILKSGFNRFFSNTTNNFIVTSSTPSPTGVKYYKLEVLTVTADLSLTDESLLTGSGSYPAILAVGTVSYGAFKNVKVSSGVVKLYI